MSTLTIIDPVSRIEGHLKVEIEIDAGVITNAKMCGTLFRGFEQLIKGRAPEDAPIITQRICGVCPISHAQASVMAIEGVTQWTPDRNARLLRNLILGANFIQSHILHFYVLSAVDFTPGPQHAPWTPSWDTDIRSGLGSVMDHFTDALTARRQAHEMGALFSGKMPHAASNVPGGVTAFVTSEKINAFQEYLTILNDFIKNTYIPDVERIGDVYGDYLNIGVGPENLLAFGAFEDDGSSRLFPGGYLEAGQTVASADFNSSDITEYVTHSWYEDDAGRTPSQGDTRMKFPKDDAYSWVKSPRLFDKSYETGPLARMKVCGDYTGGVSVLDRHLARAYEALKIGQAMNRWLENLQTGSACDPDYPKGSGSGEGLTEAPRGALGHWISVGDDGKISNYQVVTPTCWNASPRDDKGIPGPLEHALIGVPVINEKQPIEALRVVHSFDPCLACAVHVFRPSGEQVTEIPPGAQYGR
ncbi:MAG: nickel-dependent hydrogenase large subunit [Proteobacteria bacterium]|nr:nickel-dependent hydrogenase large subunit [Pseudomonadota bacterium]